MSALWHKLAVLEPPVGILMRVQRMVVIIYLFIYFGTECTGYHRVLYLSKEFGGQSLIHLANRKAAFRIQFVQKFLYGNLETSWRVLTGWKYRIGTNRFSFEQQCFNCERNFSFLL